MKCFISISVLLPAVLVAAFPYNFDDGDKTVMNLDYYEDKLIIHESKHDIVDIIVPLNGINPFISSQGDLTDFKKNLLVFYVEADIKDGHREHYGIYVYKNGKSIKVLDKGRAVAASADDSKQVFLGAEDGLYVYNLETGKTDKYGEFNRSIKDMAKEKNSDVIYILTNDLELFEVYDNGTKARKIDDVKDAEQIVIDYSNNLFYYGKDKQPYVCNADGEIKKINGLPEGAKEMRLLRPPVLEEEGVVLLIDNVMYSIYPDGRSEFEDVEFVPEAAPTAYSMESAMFMYLSHKKKIYEINNTGMVV